MAEVDDNYEIIQVVEATILAFATVAYTAGSIVAGGAFFGVRFWSEKPTPKDTNKANRLRTAMLMIALATLALSLAVFTIWNKTGIVTRDDGVTGEFTRWIGLGFFTVLLVFAYGVYVQTSFVYTLAASLMFGGSSAFALFATLSTESAHWAFFLIVAGLLNFIGAGMVVVSHNIYMLPWGADRWIGILYEILFLLNGLWLILGPEVGAVFSLWVTSLLYGLTSFLTVFIPSGLLALTFWATTRLTSPDGRAGQQEEDDDDDELKLLSKLHANAQIGRERDEVFEKQRRKKTGRRAGGRGRGGGRRRAPK